MFTAALFVVARNWKQPRCLSTKEQIKKMWFNYTVEYYSAVKNRNTRKFEGKWMELKKKIILSEITLVQRDKHGV